MDTDQIPAIIGLLAVLISIASGLGIYYWNQAYGRHGGERIDLRRQGYGPKPLPKQA